MAIEVQVQQSHIDRGAQGEGNEFSCPFALALTEHFGETFGVGASTAAIVEDIEDEPGMEGKRTVLGQQWSGNVDNCVRPRRPVLACHIGSDRSTHR